MSDAFRMLRNALCSSPILAFPDMTKPFVVATDASSHAVGAVLSQLDDDGREHSVQFASRCLSPVERNNSAFEREALAVVFAFKKFRLFLLSNKLTLLTDHQALQHTFNNRDPHGRIARWLCFLADYEFDVHGKSNGNANYCSRRPCAHDDHGPDPRSAPDGSFFSPVAVITLEEPLAEVARYLETFQSPVPLPSSPGYSSAIKRKAKNYFIADGNLFRRKRKGARFIPNMHDRKALLLAMHDDIDHWDFRATYKLISDRYWWPSMRNEVASHVRTCDDCQKGKTYTK